jgi:hypothetical protein
MKRLLLALLAVHNFAGAGVVLTDEPAAAKGGSKPTASAALAKGKVGVPAAKTGASKDDDNDEPARQYWDVRLDDQTISGTLSRWALQAKPRRQIAWELPREYVVAASDSNAPFFGTFEEAVDRVLDSFESSDYPPKGCFYSNHVVRVVRRVGDGLECER